MGGNRLKRVEVEWYDSVRRGGWCFPDEVREFVRDCDDLHRTVGYLQPIKGLNSYA